MPRIGLGIGHGLYIPSSGGGLNPDAQAFITATGITNPTEISAINTLVNDLQGYGLWTKMKAIYPFVGGTSTTCKYNLKDPRDLDAAFRLVFNGGWTFSSNGAFTNGTNSYADTKLNPLTVLSTNYPSFSAYWRNTFTAGQTNIFGACAANQIDFRMDMGYDAGVTVPFVATSSTNSDGGVGTSNTGFSLATRQGASISKMFRNGSLLINGTKTFTANPNFNFYLGARNQGGSVSYFANNQQYAFLHIGYGLTDTEASNFYTAVQAFQTTLGRQV